MEDHTNKIVHWNTRDTKPPGYYNPHWYGLVFGASQSDVIAFRERVLKMKEKMGVSLKPLPWK